ncbi:unnamed protein product [Penicillium salamii]|uniref:DUF1479 domain protein n=1 Tax=Penicillium salamii TaxID=1612424 RepID=A0A9W4J534_9EURO|nr:unnamed protein product [Penicillium salamii]CAG8125672.1 unnamed protein product [Penicillium salamii]CAG8223875.1 unnamed protein product [Penicillium salamii]CAG8305192.1 unnamed protein product [Penicillium salamii]CAG8327232.1 unnamed protein product [Penicillium salamii]
MFGVKPKGGLPAKVSRPFAGKTHSAGLTKFSTSTRRSRKEGDISSVFVSLSSQEEAAPLDSRFAEQKKRLLADRSDKIKESWDRLLNRLREETGTIKKCGPSIELRKRGVAVVRGVIPEDEARGYKEATEAYVAANPGTKAFPPNDPQVFELYWSKAQMQARFHPNMLETQRFLMSFWHSSDPNALVSPRHPLSYADRLRIRQPGDTGFALGPHIDGGSCERWEDKGYGLGDVYKSIFQGQWEDYNPWDASTRIPAVADLYNGAGACSMFRMFQGWLGLSHTGPDEGTLMVNPLLSMATAYTLLRPFFRPITAHPGDNPSRIATETFLEPSNWQLEDQPSSKLEGATPGYAQELNSVLHPHLELEKTMVHVPKIAPGDYVAWHCDTIHAVDKVHQGTGDSSVMYIPACPVTAGNVEYVKRQKSDFLAGTPPPDFPGGVGESAHVGHTTLEDLKSLTTQEGMRAFGLEKWDSENKDLLPGQRCVLMTANEILGYRY